MHEKSWKNQQNSCQIPAFTFLNLLSLYRSAESAVPLALDLVEEECCKTIQWKKVTFEQAEQSIIHVITLWPPHSYSRTQVQF